MCLIEHHRVDGEEILVDRVKLEIKSVAFSLSKDARSGLLHRRSDRSVGIPPVHLL